MAVADEEAEVKNLPGKEEKKTDIYCEQNFLRTSQCDVNGDILYLFHPAIQKTLM